MQITQFVIDICIVYFASTSSSPTLHLWFAVLTVLLLETAYAYYASTYFKGRLPSPGTCAGEEHAAIFGCSLLTSYLFLFIDFYFRTYKGGSKGKKAVINKDVGAGVDKVHNAVANGNGVHMNGNGKANGKANGNGVNGHAKGE